MVVVDPRRTETAKVAGEDLAAGMDHIHIVPASHSGPGGVLPTHTAAAGIVLSSVGILLGANRAVRILLNGLAGLAYEFLVPRFYVLFHLA